jgi:hypothetical protein
MIKAKQRPLSWVPVWLMGLLMLLISGCSGPNLPAAHPPTGKPDSVRLEINSLYPGSTKPVMTLQQNPLVQQLYTQAYQLPLRPAYGACTADAGPTYTLTFFEHGKTLVTMHADSAGCRDVTIAGESQAHQASSQFWSLLQQAIYAATPPAHPTQFSRLIPLSASSPIGQTQHIPSAAKAQRLYNAILALSLGSAGDDQHPTYWLAFQTDKQTILSAVDLKNMRISLAGNNLTKSGWYKMTQQFIELLNTSLGGFPLAPAQPDQLSTTTNARTAQTFNVTDHTLMQQLYTTMTTLPQSQQQNLPDCLGNDKINQQGTWYYFMFSQWGLPIYQAKAYEGCQHFVSKTLSGTDIYLQDNAKIWSLIHQATHTG